MVGSVAAEIRTEHEYTVHVFDDGIIVTAWSSIEMKLICVVKCFTSDIL
jgi:hypothetical protein